MFAYTYILYLVIEFGKCITVEDFTTIEVDLSHMKTCLFVSNEPIWPYRDNDKSKNYAQEACKTLGMDLAMLKSPLEDVALQELTSM